MKKLTALLLSLILLTGCAKISIQTADSTASQKPEPIITAEPTQMETPTEHVHEAIKQDETQETTYILNINTKKFHYPTCTGAKQIKDKNKRELTGSRDELISQGYEPCKMRKP